MSNPEVEIIPAAEIRNLARAVRFAFVGMILGVSYANIKVALSISKFQQIYHDMLGNKPLPACTQFVLSGRDGFILLSFALPLVATACLFLRRLPLAIYVIGVCLVLVFVELYFMGSVLGDPVMGIIQGMQGGNG